MKELLMQIQRHWRMFLTSLGPERRVKKLLTGKCIFFQNVTDRYKTQQLCERATDHYLQARQGVLGQY